LFAREHTTAVFGQRTQQVELDGGQLDGIIIDRNLASPNVYTQMTKVQHASIPARTCPRLDAPQRRLDARRQLARAERLGDVIVCAHRQADDLIGLFGTGSQHDHVHVRFAP